MEDNDDRKIAKTQGVSPLTGYPPPKERQFGQPNGNKQGRGFWKKEDTARYKLEQMIKLSEREIRDIIDDPDAPLFERRLARSLLKENEFKTSEAMMNQVYGAPKQDVHVDSNVEGINLKITDLSK